jgi:hypothetical protein
MPNKRASVGFRGGERAWGRGAGGGWRWVPPHARSSDGYGTVGTWPAFSCASRAALSVASWAALSFEWNVPLDGAVDVEELPLDGAAAPGAAAAGVVVAVAALAAPPPKR